MKITWILWALMGVQMAGWLWGITWKAGKLTDKQYIAWCICMVFGQSAAGIECLLGRAYGTMLLQAFFFVTTAIGGIKRYQEMRNASAGNLSSQKSL